MSFTLPATEIDPSVVTNWSGGEVMVTCGGVVSSVTVMLAVLTPAAVVAVAVVFFGPSARGSAMLKAPFETGAGMELTATFAVGSLTVPLTVVGLRFKKLRLTGE